MAEYNGPRKPIVKNAFSEFKTRLSAPPVNGAKRPASLAFAVVKNNPRISVYTNVDGEKDNGRIQAAMDSPTFFSLIALIEQAVDAEPDTKWTIENKNHTFFGGERSKEPKVISTTVVGKDKEGMVYMAVLAKEITPVKFVFRPTNYHHLIAADGSPADPAFVSRIYAKGYCKMLENLAANILDTQYTEPEPRPDNRNQGGGNNWNKGNNNQGGGNNWDKPKQQNSGGDWSGNVTDDFPM